MVKLNRKYDRRGCMNKLKVSEGQEFVTETVR